MNRIQVVGLGKSSRSFPHFNSPCFVEMPGLPQLWKSLSGLPQLLGKLWTSFPQSFGKAEKKLFHIPTKPIFWMKIKNLNDEKKKLNFSQFLS